MSNLPPPPTVNPLNAQAVPQYGETVAHSIPVFDFETYSECSLPDSGAARYSEHRSTEVLCMAYDLKKGLGPQIWVPEMPNPLDLFLYINKGGLLEAHNSLFEYFIWTNVCTIKYGWPTLPLNQLRCSMAKARAFGLPGALDKLGQVLQLTEQKDKRGKALLTKYSKPRRPTLANPSTRNLLNLNDADGIALLEYNLQDIRTEAEASSKIPDLIPFELAFWQLDQLINTRGVQVDLAMTEHCIAIIEQAYERYNKELYELTQGVVTAVTQLPKLKQWLRQYGVNLSSLDKAATKEILKNSDLHPMARRALEIKRLLSGSSVKKLYSIQNQVCKNERLKGLFSYHKAHTGRAAGNGPQPQNLPSKLPPVMLCSVCKNCYGVGRTNCPWCNSAIDLAKQKEWSIQATNSALKNMELRNLNVIETVWNQSPINIVSACLRGLFIAAEGHELICSDYNAIEAVVLAALAKEEWRLEVFRTHGKIYEMSASKITGLPFEEFERYKKINETHHPLRGTVGKVAELASGYQGWTGAWIKFGAEEFFSEQEMIQAIKKWRAENPKIVGFWGGQPGKKRPDYTQGDDPILMSTRKILDNESVRDYLWTSRNSMPVNIEYYGIEGAAILATISPGTLYYFKGIIFHSYNNILYCYLLSGRTLAYHKPRVAPHPERGGVSLSYETWFIEEAFGASMWKRIDTYGGKLTENIVQATARDILAHAMVNLERTGYPIVLHVHDEIIAEVPENLGSIEQFENIMSTMPIWAKDWPIKASGGWRGKRYRKD